MKQNDLCISNFVIKTIVELSKKLNMKVIAEHIEDEATMSRLKLLNVDYVQGYYFSSPIILVA